MRRLAVTDEDHRYGFGPFVGYYFRPADPKDLTRLEFLCFNEQGFYASDAPKNALLFEGEAVLVRLPGVREEIPQGADRILPVFFETAPRSWLETRPEPQAHFTHFHSCYDARGPALLGYWLRHEARSAFSYDMGGRVGTQSPLYHRATPGADHRFARAIEFDRGPGHLP
jgi:hypothetical protein